jgi:hypothetical protein
VTILVHLSFCIGAPAAPAPPMTSRGFLPAQVAMVGGCACGPGSTCGTASLYGGKSGQYYATSGTPASNEVLMMTLDDSVTTTPTWTRELMPIRRVMPNAVILPDGTIGIFNGALMGTAGGISG